MVEVSCLKSMGGYKLAASSVGICIWHVYLRWDGIWDFLWVGFWYWVVSRRYPTEWPLLCFFSCLTWGLAAYTRLALALNTAGIRGVIENFQLKLEFYWVRQASEVGLLGRAGLSLALVSWPEAR